jgi:Skp family chaperone for outer membrane proteins
MKTFKLRWVGRVLSVTLALMMIGLCSLVTAADSASESCSICVVDMRRLVQESPKGVAIKEQLKKEASRAQISLAGMKSKLDKLQKEVANQSALLSEAAKKKKSREIEDLQREFADSLRDAQENLAIKEREAMKDFLKVVDVALSKWAKTHPGAVVLEKDPSFVVYAVDSLDVTGSVKALVGK